MADTQEQPPCVLVVMGVSGSGKSTIASMLAHHLHWVYEDGDWFHPKANVEKMHHGEPLTDEDVADAIAWTVTRPQHVNIDLMVMRPIAQAAQHKVHREF